MWFRDITFSWNGKNTKRTWVAGIIQDARFVAKFDWLLNNSWNHVILLFWSEMYESGWLTYQRLFLARNSNQCLQIQTESIIPYSHWLAIWLILLLSGVVFDWEYGLQTSVNHVCIQYMMSVMYKPSRSGDSTNNNW